MKWCEHAAIGAVAAVLPDAALALYGWRKTWMSESYPLVRLHRFLHSRAGLVTLALIAYGTHLIADRYSTHGGPR